MYRITNPISNIPLNEKSHVRGWTTIWANQLDAAINHRCTPEILKSNTVYIDHGVNFGGTPQTKEIFDRINLVMACKKIVSLDWDMPDYGAMLKKRIGGKNYLFWYYRTMVRFCKCSYCYNTWIETRRFSNK